MASRWLLALVGYALIQGIIANSPEPVREDEMEEFFRMLRSPDYRLPTTTSPRHYEVNLTPYLDVAPPGSQPFTFDGTVKIFANVTAPTDRQIVLHCNDLTIITLTVTRPDSSLNIAAPEQTFVCEMPYSFLKIDVTEDLSVGDEFIIESSFRGILQSNMRGFYRSWYSEGNERRWIATTQFQPGHARQAFPCYDEPSFKATFEITINRLLEYSPTISNMPIRINDTLPNGRISETFYTTPLTSTYLLAFIVSRYQNIAANNDDIRPFDIYARGTANGTGDWALEVGEKLLARMEEYTQFPYYTMALYDGLPSMNMKQAAIPDFSAGAMENWGLLTYREANVLYDPLNSNHFYKQRVANIVAHEIAHMWFGNLVTCDWWSELWLNEGFARFYQYYLTAMVEPDLGMDTRFVIEQLQTSMFSDSLDSAHALSNPEVYDPTSVSNHFSTITYAKGASVIRMTQYLLGNETFLSGLRRYLVDRQFSTAQPHHLFEALDSAAAENNALRGYGINIAEYFKTWSEKSGHPLLTVNVNQRTGHMTVTQSRWERNSGESNSPSLWYVPVTWTRGGAPDFEDCKPSQVLTGQASFIDRGSTGLEWVIFNKQQTGFYRVNYDPTNWALLTQAMRNVTTQKEIHGHNRAQIVDDVLTFARAGLMPYNTAFNIISFLEFDEDYAPWLAAINDFEFIIRRLAHDEVNFQRFKNEIIRMSSTLTNYLGYDEKPEDSYMDGLQRMYVMQFLCDIGHSECVTAARDHFQRWRNGEHVAPNLRPWAYCVGLREGTPDDFTFFWNKYLEESLANEVVVMLQAAGCTSNQISLNTFLDAIINPSEIVRPQDVATAFNSAIGGNEENAMRVFEWLKSNVDNVIDALGTAATPISGIAGRLKNEDQITEFQNWLDENQVLLGAAYTTGINGIQTTRNNLQWSSVRIPELVQYLDVGYVEEVIDDVDVEEGGNGGGDGDGSGDNGDDGSAGTDSGEDITEGETDSANVALLSVMTLLTSVCVNVIAG